jgi:hypothetical protein
VERPLGDMAASRGADDAGVKPGQERHGKASR